MGCHGIQLKPKVYAPVAVGDQLKFGQSTRIYIFTGPGDLMPAEGPSMKERKEAAYKKALAAKQVRAQALANATGEGRGGGIWRTGGSILDRDFLTNYSLT